MVRTTWRSSASASVAAFCAVCTACSADSGLRCRARSTMPSGLPRRQGGLRNVVQAALDALQFSAARRTNSRIPPGRRWHRSTPATLYPAAVASAKTASPQGRTGMSTVVVASGGSHQNVSTTRFWAAAKGALTSIDRTSRPGVALQSEPPCLPGFLNGQWWRGDRRSQEPAGAVAFTRREQVDERQHAGRQRQRHEARGGHARGEQHGQGLEPDDDADGRETATLSAKAGWERGQPRRSR
jgi:hypothetical protein